MQTWLSYTYTANSSTTAIAEQVTATVYDQRNPQSDNLPNNNSYILNPSFQKSYLLRNRVSYTRYYDVLPYNTSQQAQQYSLYDNSTTYSYDIHGNADTLLLHYRTGVMAQHGYNQFKTVAYDYDLISGKVNNVYYQPGWNDQMTHRYEYDAENRLTNVYTTDLSGIEEQEARYYYYKHGPLAKAIIGQQQVQGMNYVYTLQGWIKAVNPDSTIEEAGVARSAFNYSLHYYNNDYAPIGTGTKPIVTITSSNTNFQPLYNGNIGAMAVNIKQFNQPLVYTYGYDQLNRLINATTYNGWNGVSTFSPSLINDYKETLTYDPNGNVQTALRNGNSAQISLENFQYNYDANNKNKLTSIKNNVGNTTYSYSYDAIGEQTKDDLEGNTNITWTVYGKIKSVTKTDGTVVTYTYDAAGNRIGKQVTKSGLSSYEWYVRDASGNTMAVYSQSTAGVMIQREVNLYGSSLIGTQRRSVDVDAAANSNTSISATIGQRGMKQYFLGNHLGNTLVTISDKRLAAVVTGGNVTAYKPDVVSATDYSSFGVSLLGRQFNGNSIEYGFNGKWNEVETGYQNYGMRDYGARARRFNSVDPITGKYPWLTPFQFASNRPVDGIDLDGLEFKTKAAYDAYWHITPATPSLLAPKVTTPVTHVSLSNVQPSRGDNARAQQKQFYVATPQQPHVQEEIAAFDPYKNMGIIGPAPVVRDNLAISKQQYYNAIGDNIAGGPFGAAGYMIGGDNGSKVGAAVDQINFSFGGVPGEGFLSKPTTITPEVNVSTTSAANIGRLTIEEMGDFSASEISAAHYMKSLGNDVLLRAPRGTRAGGGTSDLLVNGINYDVYTPKTNNVNRIIGSIANKNSQATGIVLDLSSTSVTASQLSNALQRVNGIGAKNIKDIKIIPKQ